MRITKPIILTVVISAVISACAGLATLTMNDTHSTTFQVEGTHLFMSGEINSETLTQFEDIYAENPNIKTLVELDVPGSLDDETMIALAYKVRELRLNTHLTSKSEVYSGGVDLFLAGVNRTIEPGAKVGVHSSSDGQFQAQDYPRDAPEHEMNRKYIEDMLGDDAFYWYTIQAASADDIHIMSINEIKQKTSA